MNLKRILPILAVVIGLVNGPSALTNASLSQPPIQWTDLPFILFGCIIGLLFGLGFQVVTGNLKSAYSFWKVFVLFGLFFLTSGVSALITAFFSIGLHHAHAFLFLAIGVGFCLAALACHFVYGGKWAHLTHHSSGTPNGAP